MNSGRQFESLVADVISHLAIFRGKVFQQSRVQIHRNKIYPGAKDPAGYEIDISMEMSVPPGLRLLFIVECKAHSRPVERSVVQQFIQVRDDISAHKAIIVSPHGFNEGALRLAQKAGVALWQFLDYELSIVNEYPGPGGVHKPHYEAERRLSRIAPSIFDKMGITLDLDSITAELSPRRQGSGLAQVHCIYSGGSLEVVPPPVYEGWSRVSLTPYDVPMPKNALLEWVISTLATTQESGELAGYLRTTGFASLLPPEDGLTEHESLIRSVERIKQMDLRPRSKRTGD